MIPIVPLLLIWLATRSHAPGASSSSAPAWPTPSSPPPMPAFDATPTPAHPADTATPLAELHAKPPTPPPAHSEARPKAAAKRRAAPRVTPGVLTSTLPVLKLQQALNARGANLVPDGKFGPKTAAAWSKMAASKGLPAAITRKSPKFADVVTHTFDALSIPHIP